MSINANILVKIRPLFPLVTLRREVIRYFNVTSFGSYKIIGIALVKCCIYYILDIVKINDLLQ